MKGISFKAHDFQLYAYDLLPKLKFSDYAGFSTMPYHTKAQRWIGFSARLNSSSLHERISRRPPVHKVSKKKKRGDSPLNSRRRKGDMRPAPH